MSSVPSRPDRHGATLKTTRHISGWRVPVRYSDDELLDHLRELAERLDGSPTMTEMDELGEYAADTYRRRFGSWNAALRRVGLEPNRTRDIPVGELLADLRRLAEELDRPPLVTDVRDRGAYSPGTYGDRFGSWSEALQAAGFGVRGPSAPATDAVGYLRGHGPTPVDDLPGGRPSTREKMHGVDTFALEDARATTAVAYLLDEHDEEAVLRAFFEHNPGLVRDDPLHNLVQALGGHGRRWRAAGRRVLREYM